MCPKNAGFAANCSLFSKNRRQPATWKYGSRLAYRNNSVSMFIYRLMMRKKLYPCIRTGVRRLSQHHGTLIRISRQYLHPLLDHTFCALAQLTQRGVVDSIPCNSPNSLVGDELQQRLHPTVLGNLTSIVRTNYNCTEVNRHRK